MHTPSDSGQRSCDYAGTVTSPQAQTTRRSLSGQLSAPLRSFLKTEAGGASLLLAAATIALVWANSPWSDGYFNFWQTDGIIQFGALSFDMSLGHWVNDGLMVVFFLVIGMEVRREWSIGELTDRSRAIMPIVAGFGGMIIPVLFYLMLNPSGEAVNGWGIVIGTDTAFMLGALALVGPSYSTQLRLFLLTLTVVDDIIAVSVIGVVYSDNIDLGALGIAAVCLAALVVLDRLGVWQSTPYLIVVIVLWAATVISGVHPSIAGMVAGLLIPAMAVQRRHVEDAKRLAIAFRQSPQPAVGYSAKAGLARAVSVNERLQLKLHPWTSYLIVPIFALANAGVDLRDGVLQNALSSPVTWGIVIGLVFGKTIGIGIAALLAQRYRIAKLPTGVAPGHVFGGAALSGIGFTVSLLIIELAFGDSPIADEARVGVLLATLVAVIVGGIAFWIAARWRGETSAGLPVVLDPPVDPEQDHIRGPVDAPLTLVEYSDFECPYCARVTGVSQELRAHYGDRLRYVFRHVTLPDVHSHSELAAHAAEAAANQGKFWEMHDKMFEHQDELELEDLAGYAHEIDLDIEQFLRDIDDPDIARRVQDHVAGAEASGVRGTPTFFVDGLRHRGPHDAQSLIKALDESTEKTPKD